jgi:hypothetical protein
MPPLSGGMSLSDEFEQLGRSADVGQRRNVQSRQTRMSVIGGTFQTSSFSRRLLLVKKRLDRRSNVMEHRAIKRAVRH